MVQIKLAAALLAAIKTSLQMLLVQPRQFFPDAFGCITVPSALHLSDPFSVIYDFAIFRNQVLTNIWHSAPHHSGRPRKLFCVRRKMVKMTGAEAKRNAEDSN